jgi:hypothetical protein
MKDINFFSVYSKQKSVSTGKKLKAFLIVIAVILVVGGSYVALFLYRGSIDSEAARIDTYLQSDEVRNKVAAVNKYKSDLSILDQYGLMVDQVLKNLKAADYANAERMDKVSAALPAGVTMKSISIEKKTAVIAFYVPDVATAAQVVTALAALDCFKSVSVLDIDGSAEQGVTYTATIGAELKGGDAA